MNELQNIENNEMQMMNENLYQDATGKFRRRASYKNFSSVQATTREEKIQLYKLIEEENDLTLPLSENVWIEIDLKDVIFKTYDSVDELTGEIQAGVLTYLFDRSGKVYVTSSKSVYFSLNKIFNIFGEPTFDENNKVFIKVVKKQGRDNKFIDISLIA